MALLMLWAEIVRRKKIRRIADKELIRRIMPDASAKRRWFKFVLSCIAIALVVIMVARPQMGTKVSHEKREGIEAIICLDISNSMLAADVAPSRLAKSKMLIENLVDHFTKDKIGMVVFAGDAYVQLPITSDYVSAKMFLQNIEPSLIQSQGTNIAEAINLASNSFTQQQNIGKAIIVITDGEDHEGGALEAAQEASDKGYKVFILGIGNTTGAPIPASGGGYLTDNSGNTVMTALNEKMCHDIAAAGRGTYIHVDNTSTAQEMLNDEISKMQKGSIESMVYSEYSEQYQWFGILAIIVLIIETLLSEAVNPYFRKITLFRRTTVILTLLAVSSFFSLDVNAQVNDRHYIRKGNREFHSNNQNSPSQAEVQYRKALAANKLNPQAQYNLGCALMAQNKDSLAMEMFQASAKSETSKQRKAMSYHNMGVILQQQQQFDAAIEMYKQALRLMPHDNETRYNLVLCQRQRKNNNNQNQNQNNKDNNKNKDNKDKKDKNQDKNDQDKNNQDNNKEKQQKQQQQMSKENAEQLLQAAIQKEKDTQQRLNKAMSQPRRNKTEKNW